MKYIFFLFILFLIAILTILPSCQDDNIKTFNVSGNSMNPAILPGAEAKVDFDYYKWRKIKTGDIVVYKFQTRPHYFVKRVVAIPGDILLYEDNKLFIRDQEIKGDAPILMKQLKHYDYIVPPEQYLALGDNQRSIDSKSFGLIPREYILGKVIAIDNHPDKKEKASAFFIDTKEFFRQFTSQPEPIQGNLETET